MIINSKNLTKTKYKLGGKANSLIMLTQNKIPVPAFCVVSSQQFKDYLNYNNLSKPIQNWFSLSKYNMIKKSILNGAFPKNLIEEITEALKYLKIDKCLVRSSASNEDGAKQSFAGQYETFLNVLPSKVFEYIKKCWCSLFDKNVIAYTGKNKMDIFGMNVVIQQNQMSVDSFSYSASFKSLNT